MVTWYALEMHRFRKTLREGFAGLSLVTVINKGCSAVPSQFQMFQVEHFWSAFLPVLPLTRCKGWES